MKVERVKSGVYRADFYDCNNRRCRPTIEAPNKKEAERKAKRLAKVGLAPVVVEVGGMSLGDALRRADKEHYVNTKNRKKSSGISDQIEEAFGSLTPIRNIDYEMIQEVITRWMAEGQAGSTVNRKLSLLYKTLRLALLWKEGGKRCLLSMPQIPKKQKETKGRTRVITKDEEKAALEILTGTHKDLFIVLIDTGMRLGEVLGMQYPALNFKLVEHRAVSGMHSWAEINLDSRRIHIWVNKGDLPRTVPMTDRVFEILERRIDLPVEFVNTDKGTVRDTRPFKVTHDQVTSQWRKLRKKMNLEDDKGFTPHACRHSCATRLWEVTSDIYLVKEWLGHANVSTTERYTHLSSSKLDAAMKLMGGLS